MTIIVYRDGIMASDGGLWANFSGLITSNNQNKIKRLPNGSLFGAAGSLGPIQQVYDWVIINPNLKGEVLPGGNNTGVGAILVKPDGQVFILDNTNRFFSFIADWYCVGSAAEFTSGCLACGKSALEAVELAIKYNSTVSGEIFVEDLLPIPKPQPETTTSQVIQRSTIWWIYKLFIKRYK
jgi:hypothetical protein